ncbi:hypothetical protein SO802_015108 [Lithocarpus litseifolius]|uniref:DUF4283 domain-containing protein n=1 Tax=Lithocarpus litseifolius TaxID=425828 RepID=A0AAW2CSS7_9ROSI
MENLSVMWEKLSLSEGEGEIYRSSTMDQYGGKVLAARFFMHRTLNMEAIARTFKPLWRTKRSFEVKDMGNHIILFVFSYESDADRVLMGEPWSYDKYLVSLQKMDKNVPVNDLVFNKTLFWVQIHDLPLGDMNPNTVCAIGSNIGTVQEGLKEWGTQDGSSFMRIRVLVDTSIPLCRGRKVSGDNGKVQSRGTLTEQDQQFGGWLTAPPITVKRCSVVRVEGSGEATAAVKEQQVDRYAEAPMDMSEVQVYGNLGVSRTVVGFSRVDNGAFGVSGQCGERMDKSLHTSFGNFEEQGASPNDQFQDKLKEIDADLAKFDSSKLAVHSTPTPTDHIFLSEEMDPNIVQETEEDSEAPRSITRGWKRLLQIRETSQVEPNLSQSKRRVQEILEDDGDVIPLKKCCASAKSNETVEAVIQPRREQ